MFTPSGPAADKRSHTISVLVENRPGVLARVASLFARRDYNINSLAVSTTEKPGISRMTVVTTGDERELQQITKQLNKLIDVIQVMDHTDDVLLEREIALIKVHASHDARPQVMQVAQVFRAEILSISPKDETMVLEVTGDADRVDALLDALSGFEVREMVRTGKIALVRGAKQT
ncbi:MAG: acetolactate synthase small subunit [Deltaproteobacteria bacterium]|nr:acetolactate synthase small subunit [Deltaproteobacteria bacterium]